MRSCAYCGKDLAAGEVCDCPGSVRARNAKNGGSGAGHSSESAASESSTGSSQSTYSGWQENTYQTGYTKKDKKKKFHHKFKFRKPKGFNKDEFKGAASGVSGFTKRFIHDPVNTVSNPGHLSMVQIILLVVLIALVMSVGGFFAYTRVIAVYIRQLMTMTASTEVPFINSMLSTYHIKQLLTTALYGTVSITLLTFLYFLVLYLVNRFILRQRTAFSDFLVRPAAAMIPILVFGLVGIAINFFSVYAMIMLFLTGLVMWIVLTYEGLRSEWSFLPAVRVMYMMALSFFIFFVVLFNIFRVI